MGNVGSITAAKTEPKKKSNVNQSLSALSMWIIPAVLGVGVHICLSSPFLINILLGAIFFFQIACHIQLQLCLSSPDPTPISPTTIPIFSPMDTYSCFQCQFISFLHSSQTRRVLLSFFGLLPDFLHVRIKEFLCFKEKMLKELPALFSPAPLSPRAVSFQEFSSSNAFNK